jgi:hypothetical protein
MGSSLCLALSTTSSTLASMWSPIYAKNAQPRMFEPNFMIGGVLLLDMKGERTEYISRGLV